MPTIRQLSPSVINKIAAGEVIERPASVVKELVENSVDAGATHIEVHVTKGGADLIRVTDNGCGISEEQLNLAVASHATSKICDADDLFHVTSMGFRGEALASIAEISHFRIRSRTSGDTAGAELEVNGGSPSEIAPCGCPVGTTIEVRNLFFNTPVRRKFMRTTQTEMGHISEAFTRIALAYDNIHFTLNHNDRVVYDLPASGDWKSRIAVLCGREIADSLLWVEAGKRSEDDDRSVTLAGYVADPSQNRANNRMQYLFLNRRHIRDRALSHALAESYRGLIMTGRYPIAFLRIEMPPDAVDVNVHPTKLEVRFQDSGQVYQRLLGAIRSRFLGTDLTARAQLSAPDMRVDEPTDSAQAGAPLSGTGGPPAPHVAPSAPIGASADWLNRSPREEEGATAAHLARVRNQPVAATELGRQSEFNLSFGSSTEGLTRREFDSPSGASTTQAERANGLTNRPLAASCQAAGMGLDGTAESISSTVHADIPLPTTTTTVEGTPAMQVYNRYLITETREGVVVIDQHALHERILYEQLRERVLSESVEVQKLLVPEPVTLPPAEAAAVLDHQAELSKMGIDVEPFGGETILISAYPAMLANLSPSELLHEIAEKLMTPEKNPDRRDLFDSLLHMISCKAAVKAGDKLSRAEVASLIEHRHMVQDAHHCPHGRPTTLIFTRDELDRRFKRT
ncbi:MAG: DNA mismatch repair endonuclease MutL [Planctomycetales bacterium]|nr:DNA mismatch repair endonuclease MutL [Planctomycetales bacterium]